MFSMIHAATWLGPGAVTNAEQYLTYWNNSGRRMFMNAIKDIG